MISPSNVESFENCEAEIGTKKENRKTFILEIRTNLALTKL